MLSLMSTGYSNLELPIFVNLRIISRMYKALFHCQFSLLYQMSKFVWIIYIQTIHDHMSNSKQVGRNWWSAFNCNTCTIIVFTIHLSRKHTLVHNGFVYYVAMVVNKWTVRRKWTTLKLVYHVDGFLARKSVDKEFYW